MKMMHTMASKALATAPKRRLYSAELKRQVVALSARIANGRRSYTRALQGIDQNVKVNRALWILAEEMKRLKA